MDNSDLYPTCPPSLNNDIAGIGVRVSFYLQALFMALLSAGSTSHDEIAMSLYTLVVTNLAMVFAALILGYKKSKEITLQDGLIITYLLSLSWTALQTAFPSYHHRKVPGSNKHVWLERLAVVQSYLLFAFAMTLLVGIKTFGSTPECNSDAVISLFVPIRAIQTGRIIWLTIVGVTLVIYSFVTACDHIPVMNRFSRQFGHGLRAAVHKEHVEVNIEISKRTESTSYTDDYTLTRVDTESFDGEIAGRSITQISCICLFWGMLVANTELMIKWNRFSEPAEGDSIWQFGQILQLLLAFVPLISVAKMIKQNQLFLKIVRYFQGRRGTDDSIKRALVLPGAFMRHSIVSSEHRPFMTDSDRPQKEDQSQS